MSDKKTLMDVMHEFMKEEFWRTVRLFDRAVGHIEWDWDAIPVFCEVSSEFEEVPF